MVPPLEPLVVDDPPEQPIVTRASSEHAMSEIRPNRLTGTYIWVVLLNCVEFAGSIVAESADA